MTKFMQAKGVVVHYCSHDECLAVYHYTVDSSDVDIDNPLFGAQFDVRDVETMLKESGEEMPNKYLVLKDWDRERHRNVIRLAIKTGWIDEKGPTYELRYI